MGRFASNLKLEEIKRLAQAKQYMKAMKILDTLNVDKIRKMADLMVIAEILINNERFDEAMEILLRIYDKSCSRKIIESLIELSIKMKNYEEAEEFFHDYLRIAPKDPYRWILKYRIDKARHVSNNDLIDTLESLKREDYSEEWAYELAKLYHKTKQVDKCVDECNDIVLWFGQGIIVDKAKLLREHYTSGLNLTEGFGAGEFDATRSLEEVIRQVKYIQSQKTESQVKYQDEMPLEFENEIMYETNLEYNAYRETVQSIEDPANYEGEVASYEESSYQEEYSFEKNTTIEEDYSFEKNVTFREETSFEENATFEERASFEENVTFGEGTLFEENATFGEGTSFEENATCGEGTSFDEESAFNRDTTNEVSESDEPSEGIKEEYISYADDELINSISENLTKNVGIKIAKELNVKETCDIINDRKDMLLQKESEEVHEDNSIQPHTDIDEDGKENVPSMDSSQPRSVKNEAAATIETKDSKVHTLTEQELDRIKNKMKQLQNYPVDRDANSKSEDLESKTTDTDSKPEDIESRTEYKDSRASDWIASINFDNIFKNFIHIKSIKDQIMSIIHNMDTDKRKINFMVCGDARTGKTTLARSIAAALYKMDILPSPKIAKISAMKLNTIDLPNRLEQLADGAIVIEYASMLDTETVKQIIDMIEKLNGRIIVFLEDRTRNMEDLLVREMNLRQYFSNRVIVPMYSAKDLAGFAKNVAKGKEYTFDEKAEILLENMMDQFVKVVSGPEHLSKINELVTDIIKRTDTRNMLGLMSQAKEGRFSARVTNLIIEEDLQQK